MNKASTIWIFALFLFLVILSFVSADHSGPERIVDGKYVVTLALSPLEGKGGMNLRIFFRDIESGKRVENVAHCSMIIKEEEEKDNVLFRKDNISVVQGIGEVDYVFPEGGTYDVFIEFSTLDETEKIHTPSAWGIWVPGLNSEKKYPFGLSEIGGFIFLAVFLVIIAFNLYTHYGRGKKKT